MSVVAILFLVMCAARLVLYFSDDGFGGVIWNTILWVSSTGWILAGVLALYVLGLWPEVNINW